MSVGIEALDALVPIAEQASTWVRRRRGCVHCDIRLGATEVRTCVAENGTEKASTADCHLGLGVRVVAEDGAMASGFYGQVLGSADLARVDKVLREAVRHAYARARANAQAKHRIATAFSALGKSLLALPLATVPVVRTQIPPTFRIDPRSVPLEEVVRLVTRASRSASAVSPQVAFNTVIGGTALVREVFVSSEGSAIDRTYALTEGLVFVTSRGETGHFDLYDFTGHQRGWEVLTEGYRTAHISLLPLEEFARQVAATAVEVSNAPPLRPPEGEVVVVTDPHFNALVCHEVVGHPSELDRALKMETAYAGRSWLFKDLQENMLGKQVASPLVSVVSDPTMEGFGSYPYDHEGTPARRVYNIRNGIYTEFLSSRQTAPLLGLESNGHYVATEPFRVPLIRMSNTAFLGGNRDPQEILREVERGWYVVGHRIPSVAESRENFRISAVKIYEIRNGQVGQLYRDGAVMADTRDFFMRIDAVGNDFRLFPIPNCGKGQPMQAKRMSNGGPTLRSIARLTGTGRTA
ncbi:Metalloprotease TldD [bacterium HR23]|nr:Metalloprotease TldD [bacterium HR23]